ncbi:MAG: CDP-glucose 4,6-dehydratase [Lactobacillales bacterium]|jgi:CDP-glucose 4,6-dehydratase|nr:CDP-glucose 4,6-dehydratase [Lactobacillales bacterium]
MPHGRYGVVKNKSMLEFYKGKNVFVTGHTGFKGSWLCRMLIKAGANVTGYSLNLPTSPSLFKLANIKQDMISINGDIRDLDSLRKAFLESKPEVVFHLAAQSLVRKSYANPVETYSTNVMGTVNILECIRNSSFVKSFLNVTTDKVYQNNEWEWGYREIDPLDGFDPYSNSKSCSELATHSYKSSFFADNRIAISTARAGNVIGGGDFSKDRIIPDCVRAIENNEKIIIRNPHSIRPYQHVLEPIYAYLLIVEKQYKNKKLADYYNIGPDECDCISTESLVNLFCEKWGDDGPQREIKNDIQNSHEANFLKLDCSRLKMKFGWQPCWNINEAVEKTVDWTKAYFAKNDVVKVMDQQIEEFLEIENSKT